MENNFFVGIINHKKKIGKNNYQEKVVLYSKDNINYIDLVNDITYTTNELEKDYVVKESLIDTDISEYQTDYLYLLIKHKNNSNTKKRKYKLFH